MTGYGPVKLLARSHRKGEPAQRTDIERDVSGRAAPGVITQVIADDGIVISLDAVMQAGVVRKFFFAPDRSLITLHRMVIGEYLRAVAIEHKQVAVPAE